MRYVHSAQKAWISGGSGAGGGTRTCPANIISLNVCSPLLGGILGAPQGDCCAVLGILGLDHEICLCLAIEANVLGNINIDIPKLDIVARSVTACGRTLPPNFTCPPSFLEKAWLSFSVSVSLSLSLSLCHAADSHIDGPISGCAGT
ncbi:hypothetical protein KP509_18G056700 [Ceratopteris richardii]|uniref:Bifunctional inhibitor/plant lipid transfer protein/seed storage helical domain-containing protein n=1 Tax=Ceratopteris richardii TaxID=49495 RepID=A0A8T2SPV0_CERRI|nr:hypothetical protein KP509_18G056700 [Ceratopteris richardii]